MLSSLKQNKKGLFLKYIKALALVQILLITPTQFLQANTPSFKPVSEYEAQYQLKSSKYKMSAKATRTLNINSNNKATLKQEASVFIASIDQTSTFEINKNNCHIIAQHYYYKRKVFGKRKDYRIRFDHKNNQFVETKNDKEKISEIHGEVYDELSYQEALRCELQNNPNIKVGHEFSYIVRTKGKNKHYNFLVSAFEKIDTKIGELNSVRISRIRAANNKKNDSHIWFSKDHDFLLVKFRQKDNDDTYVLDINKLK